MSNTSGLVNAFKKLRNRDPIIFDEMVREFETYTYSLAVDLVLADKENVDRVQGMARQSRHILQLLKTL